MKKEVIVGGRRLRYQEAGQGYVVVLIHAFPLHSDMWAPQLEDPVPGWRVIAPDLRGFGDPDAPAGSATSMDDYAGDIVDLLDHLHVDSAVIGGLSLGGYVTFALRRRAAHLFRALILADTRPQADAPETREARLAMQDLVRREGPAAVAAAMLPKLLGEETQALRPEVGQRVRELITSGSPGAIVDALTTMMTRPDSTPELGGIRCPTLILVGEQDRLTPVGLSEEMARTIRGSRLAVIPGAGHLSNLEQPELFNAELRRFLTDYV